tara:strand:- start:309 stop:485 length:177 start_codon:yes stop_codon:yes gene_type:complete
MTPKTPRIRSRIPSRKIPLDTHSAPKRKRTVELSMYDNCPILIAITFALLEKRSAATA